MYTNANTDVCMWMSDKYFIKSNSKDQYKMMRYTHELLRENNGSQDTDDITEGIRFLLSTNGKPIK